MKFKVPSDFKCKQCGNCCLNLNDAFQTSVLKEDIELWKREGRDDILDWVMPIEIGERKYVYDIWLNPKTGDDVQRCPWLRKLPNKNKYQCRINDVKPKHCQDYPISKKHASETGCKGFQK